MGDGRLLDESNSAAWLLSPESMLGGGDKATQAEVTLKNNNHPLYENFTLNLDDPGGEVDELGRQ